MNVITDQSLTRQHNNCKGDSHRACAELHSSVLHVMRTSCRAAHQPIAHSAPVHATRHRQTPIIHGVEPLLLPAILHQQACSCILLAHSSQSHCCDGLMKGRMLKNSRKKHRKDGSHNHIVLVQLEPRCGSYAAEIGARQKVHAAGHIPD